jgi:hypothetical protein
MPLCRLTGLSCVLALGAATAADAPPTPTLEQRAAAIRPSAAETRWQQVPWLGSLVEARAAARAEKRPVLVWTLDEDPFERC